MFKNKNNIFVQDILHRPLSRIFQKCSEKNLTERDSFHCKNIFDILYCCSEKGVSSGYCNTGAYLTKWALEYHTRLLFTNPHDDGLLKSRTEIDQILQDAIKFITESPGKQLKNE